MRLLRDYRLVVPVLVVVIVILLVRGGMFYFSQKQRLLEGAEEDLLTIAGLKVDQIVAWRAERLGDAAVLMEDPFLSETAAHWLDAPSDRKAAQLLTRFRSLREHFRYQDIQLVDAGGQVRLSLSGRDGTADPNTLDCLAEAWDRRRPVIVDLHVNPSEAGPVTEVIAPIFVVDDEVSVPAGAFILQSDAEVFLYPLIQSWPESSASAETLIVRRDGDSVLFLNDLRHQADTALTLRIPLSRSDLPAVIAVQGQEGVVQGVDYRGVEVLSALKAVPDSPWFMVAKVDRSEALAVWRSRSTLILALLVGLVAAAVAAVGVVWQASQRAHFQRQFEAESELRIIEARHRATLMSVDEGVIVTDDRGSVELMNPAAERLTGWSGADAAGKPLAEVYRLIDETTRRHVRSPVDRILDSETVEHLENRLLLINRDGREVAITESVAPIPSVMTQSSGVVLVFRDQTEDRLTRRITETRLALIEFAARHTLDELLVEAVDNVAGISDSAIGFFHFVQPDQKTLSLQQWSTRTVREFCKAEGKGMHYDVDQAGVWVDCIFEKVPVVHNDYPSLPHKRGLPEGHAEVVRELVAPVIREDKVVAILGVGNKPVDYTPADVDIVSYLADVTWQIVEQKKAEETITKKAYHDPLTELPNRLLLKDRLKLAMADSRRRGDSLALMMLDLDRFKDVNDTWGHEVGDRLLQEAADRLRSLMRESDTVARIGGDEFCLLLPGMANLADAAKAAEKIVTSFETVFTLAGLVLKITTSVGVALFPEHGEDDVSLMRNADRAMYRAKRDGRSTYQCYEGDAEHEGISASRHRG